MIKTKVKREIKFDLFGLFLNECCVCGVFTKKKIKNFNKKSEKISQRKIK